jgi:hypothetical protein
MGGERRAGKVRGGGRIMRDGGSGSSCAVHCVVDKLFLRRKC